MNRLEANIGALVTAFYLYYILQELRIVRNDIELQTASIMERGKDMRKLEKKVDDLIKEIYAARITRELERYREQKQTSEGDEKTDKGTLSAVSQVNTGLPPNAVLHPLTSPATKSLILYCQDVNLDRNSSDTNWIHVNHGGEIVNRPDPNKPLDRFQPYGRIRTIFPVAFYGHPVYWEIKVKVTLTAPLQDGDIVMTIGLCIAEACDITKYEFSLEYGSSLEMRRVENDTRTPINHHTLANHAGSTGTFRYGVVVDRRSDKLGLLSLSEPFSWYSADLEYTSWPLWPFISLNSGDKLSTSVKLVVGREIDVTEYKKHLVLEALRNGP